MAVEYNIYLELVMDWMKLILDKTEIVWVDVIYGRTMGMVFNLFHMDMHNIRI